jgi:REP element-mobilizing transposase RayT
MARPPRHDAPGVIHHVTIRGIERRDIFDDDRDRLEFLRRLREEQSQAGFACLAWALMSNHVHLIVKTGLVPLSKFMQRLNGGYALAFNRRHERTGYLLQDRFHSSLIEDDAYRSVAVRYVFLNPVRAGVVPCVAALESFPWTGFSELTGRCPRGILAVDEVLDLLGAARRGDRATLTEWVRAVADIDLEPVPHALPESAGSSPARVPSEARAAHHRARGWTLDHLIAWAAAACGASEVHVRSGRRGRSESRARAVIASLGTGDLGLDLTSIATGTGVKLPAISRAVRRGDAIVRTNDLRLPRNPPREVNK